MPRHDDEYDFSVMCLHRRFVMFKLISSCRFDHRSLTAHRRSCSGNGKLELNVR